MRLITPLLFVCIIGIALFRMVPNLDNHPFFVDEYGFVRKSYFYYLYFVKHDLSDKRWYDSSVEGDAAQPKVGPYIYGFVFHILGYNDIEKTFEETGFNTITVLGRPWYEVLWLKEPNTFPVELRDSMKLIFIARRVAMIFTIGSVALLFILCTMLTSPFFAYAASILLIANPLFSWEGRFAMTDTMQLFFFLSGLILLVLWQRAWNGKKIRRIYLLSIGLGVVSAVAVGVKVTAIMLFLFTLLYTTCIFVIQKSSKKRIWEFFIAMGLVVLIFCGLFYILHPYLYHDLIHNLYIMFHNRLEYAKTSYMVDFPDSAIPSRLLAIQRIYLHTLAPNAWYGNFSLWGLPVDLLLFTGGLVALVRNAKTRLIVFWTGFVFLCLVYYLYNDWSRYYLPFVTCVCMTQGYAIIWLATRIRRQFR
jgi:hypothetical protein